MKIKQLQIVVAAVLAAFGFAEVSGAQERSSSQRTRSSAKKVSKGDRNHASRGTVRYQQTDRNTGSRGNSATQRTRVPSSDRSATRVRTSSGRDVQRQTSQGNRSYDSVQSRNHARTGSLSYHRGSYDRGNYNRRGYNRPTQLPSYPSHRDVHVRRYPRYGTHITHLPSQHRLVTYRGHRYYYGDGVYYRPYGNVYRVVRPPIGFSLTYLPDGYVSVFFGGRQYYRYENTYYVDQIVDNEPAYVVVQPPDQVIVDYLPPDSREVYYMGRQYFVDIYEETAYAPVIVDGYTRYRLTDLDVDVDYDDGRIEIEIDD